MATSPSVLPVRLDRARTLPLPVQLAEQIRQRLREGRLSPGDRLPSTRALAVDLGVARSVAEQAYDQLRSEGWLSGRRGSGTYVAAQGHPQRPAGRVGRRATGPASSLPDQTVSLRPGEPWTPAQPSSAWRRAWREVAAAPAPGAYPDPRGLPELRTEVADLLNRTRGLDCSPDEVLITAGTTHGMVLTLEHLRVDGAAIAVEDPGYRAAATAAYGAQWQVWDAPVDREGMLTDRLTSAPATTRAFYVTAAHQYPLGGLLPVPRRLALLEEARRRDALVLEDDYDSEFRYDVAPLPALAQLDPDRVVHLGTVAKTLGAGLRLGWLVASQSLVTELAERRRRVHDHPPWPLQRALLSLLRDGEWDRLVRQAKRRYSRRSQLVAERLGGYGELLGLNAGMHATLLLPDHVARPVAAEASKAGVDVPLLADHARSREVRASRLGSGLVIGYGRVADADLERALDILGSSLAIREAGRHLVLAARVAGR